MNRKLLFIPLALFLALAAALFWQLMRNADGDDPTTLESALMANRCRSFAWKRWIPPVRRWTDGR